MGATLSEQWDSKCEEDEQHSVQDELPEDSAEEKLLQKNEQLSSQNGRTESQTDEMNSQSEERDLVDVGSGFVTLNEDASDMSNSIQEGDMSNNSSKQTNNADEVTTKEGNESNNKVNDTEIGFKKIFRFGGFKFTLKKDKVEKILADETVEIEKDRNAAGPSEDSWDDADVNHILTNEQDTKEIKIERIGVDACAGPPKTHSEKAAGTEHRDEGVSDKSLMQDISQSPEPEQPMTPIKQFFSSLKKRRKEIERPKENNDEELKNWDKVVEKESTKEDTTCTCLDISNGAFDEDKDLQLYMKDESKPAPEGDIMNSDKVQASPFKRLFRKISTRRQSETKHGDPNSLDPGENISEDPQLSTELIKSHKEHKTKVVETQPGNEMIDMSHEESKKKSDSSVSWENLLCVRSARTRSRKTSDSEDETQAKGGVPRGTSESPFESSTEGDHLTSSNEQGGSPADEDSGSTWKSFKKLVTPRSKSRVEESGSVEQMHLETEITEDESSCSLRKLISGRKKIKSDGQHENISSDEVSKGTGTDIEDDETPGVVPLSEYELGEPKLLDVSTDETVEIEKENELQPIIEEDKPKQIQPLYDVKPLSFDASPSSVPIPTEYTEDLTEFLSKHQQLSDIPEEGIIEESVATPLSFVEWTTQYDTLADDIVDMTADAITAPEHPSENNEDETSEMVSAVSHLSESPKTSGNVTPVSPAHHKRVSDTIFQIGSVESVSMIPSLLSNTTQDSVPETQAVSVSQFIVESTTTTKAKVLLTHKREEAKSICIGIVCKEIRAEAVHPLPLFEGISEINYAFPTEFVSGDFAEVCEAAEMPSDNVFGAEIKTMLNEVLSLEEQSTILAENAKKSEPKLLMVDSVPEEGSPVVQMENMEVDSTELLNGIYKSIPDDAVVYGESQLFEEKIFKQNMNRPETAGRLQPALEEPANEQMIQNTQIHFEIEKEHRIQDVELSAADVEQLQVSEVGRAVEHSVVAFESDPALNHAFEMTENIAGDKNAKRVPALSTTIETASAFNNIKMTEEVENAKQQIEHTSADMTEEISNEKIVYSFKVESLSEIIVKPPEEMDISTFVRESILTPNPTETGEDTKKQPAISEQARGSEGVAEGIILTETLGNTSDEPELQKDILSVKLEESQATESIHKPCEEINQVTNTAKTSETNLSILYEEQTEEEYKILAVNEHVMNKLNSEILEVADSKSDIIVVSETQAETPVLASLNPEPEAGAPVVTSTEKTINMEALALTSLINHFQSDLKSVNEPEDSTGATLHKNPIVVSEMQTGLFIPQTVAPSTVLKEVLEKDNVNINKPNMLEVSEPKLYMLSVTETRSCSSVVSALDVQTTETSALNTETLVEEKDVKAQSFVVTSIKEDTDVNSVVLTSTINEVQVQAEAQRPTVVPVIETLAVNSAVGVVEIPIAGPELKEGHCDAQAAANIKVEPLFIIEQVAENMETTKNSQKKTESPEEICGRLKVVSVPIMNIVESPPGANEDIWEDAIDDIRDDQFFSTKVSGGL